jgi:hypothetical protein
MNPEARARRCTRGGGRAWRPHTATFLVFTAACGGRYDIGHGAPDSVPVPVYAGAHIGSQRDGGPAADPDGGTATPMVIATQQGWASLITSDATRVYWMFFDSNRHAFDSYVLRGCDPSDCRDTVVTYVEHVTGIQGLAADGLNVYWVMLDAMDMSTTASTVHSCPVSGCPATGPRTVTPLVSVTALQVTPQVAEGALVADGSHVYWAQVDGTILRCPVAGCTGDPEVIGTFDGSPTSLAVDDSSVYATVIATQSNAEVGRVFAADKSVGATPRLIADNQLSPSSVTPAGGRVYWTTEHDDGEVMACDAAGCAGAPSVIASGLRRPQSLLVDATHAYFLTESLVQTAAPGAMLPPLDVVACPLAGCGASLTILAATNSMRPPMVAAGSALFWMDPLPSGDAGTEQPSSIEGIAK